MRQVCQLAPERKLLGPVCWKVVLAKLGLIDGVPECTDVTTKRGPSGRPSMLLNQPLFSHRATSPDAGGCLALHLLAAWMIAA